MKLQHSRGRHWLTIPVDACKMLGWKKGDHIGVVAVEKGLLLKKIE